MMSDYPTQEGIKKALDVESILSNIRLETAVVQEMTKKLEALFDKQLTEVIRERDRYHEIADDLAQQIASITGDDIGEHSSANDPWHNAMLSGDEYIATRMKKLLTPPIGWVSSFQRGPAMCISGQKPGRVSFLSFSHQRACDMVKDLPDVKIEPLFKVDCPTGHEVVPHAVLQGLRDIVEAVQSSPDINVSIEDGSITFKHVGFDILVAMNDGFNVTKHDPISWLTDEANAEMAWSVERRLAPFCSPEGTRTWTGRTPTEAIQKARSAIESWREQS